MNVEIMPYYLKLQCNEERMSKVDRIGMLENANVKNCKVDKSESAAVAFCLLFCFLLSAT